MHSNEQCANVNGSTYVVLSTHCLDVVGITVKRQGTQSTSKMAVFGCASIYV